MHEDMRALLNAYLDGELHGTRLQEMKLHLSACEACRNELKELRLVSDLLTGRPRPGVYAGRAFRLQPGPQPAAPDDARPASETRFPGLVARAGGVAGSLVLRPDGVHTHRRGYRCANDRPAGAGRQMAETAGRRQSGSQP